MSREALADLDVEAQRVQRLSELAADLGPDWARPFVPGSSGCHELLDRTSMIADNVERYILDHPSCARDAEWYALADRAVTALRELYQSVGAAHLDDGEAANGRENSPIDQGPLR